MRSTLQAALPVAIVFAAAGGSLLAGPATASAPKERSVSLKSFKVTLSQPVLVARSPGYLWFPTLAKLGTGELLALMSDYPDKHVKKATAQAAWSNDEGRTWSATKQVLYGDVNFTLPNGDQLLLPYYLYPRPGGMGGAYQVMPKGTRKTVDRGEVRFTGWPQLDRSFAPDLGLAGFVTNGQVVKLKNGSYLCNLYGYFKDQKRYALVAAESTDGVDWKVRAVIADGSCKLKGAEGPCEAALARLKDGRLLSVFRLASNVPYGRCFSSDDGKTWTEPASMPADVFSVQPSLVVLPDGAVALSGGRPGLYLWLNADGSATTWECIDIQAHHNATVPTREEIGKPGGTSSYTEIVALDPHTLLMIYDRIPRGWQPIPPGSKETNSVWVVRIGLEKKEAKPMDKVSLTPGLRRRCLEVLRQALQQPEPFFAGIHAAEALTLAGHGDEVRALYAERLASDRDPKHRIGMAREMYRAGDKTQAGILLELLASPDVDVRVHAAESLYKIGEIGDGKLLRQAFQQTESTALRTMAAGALAKRGDAEARAFLRKSLSDEKAGPHAAWVLGRIGDATDVPALRKLADLQTRPMEKSFCEHALACLGDGAGRKALAVNLRAPDPEIRALAAEHAGHSQAVETATILTVHLDDPVMDVRVRSAQALLMLAE